MFSFLRPTLGSSLRARFFTLLIGTFFIASPLFAHTVTVFWCVDPSGSKLRLWHEHWHGNQSTITATLDITVIVNGGTPLSFPATPPSGVINDTPRANLPCDYGPCGVGQQILRTTSRSAVYNDWAYWDVDLRSTGLCDDANPVVNTQVTAANPSDFIFFNFEGTVPATANANLALPDCTVFQITCDAPASDPIHLGCLDDVNAFNSLLLTPPSQNDPDATFSFRFVDSAPTTVGCTSRIDRTYTHVVERFDPCLMERVTTTGTCVSAYTMTFNTGGPNIDSVQAFQDYGCDGDRRPLSESQSNVVTSDPDNNITSFKLDSETRVTNDCQVTVTRIWEVEDCCDLKDQAVETYVFNLTPGDIGNTTLETLRVGCISSAALIPAPTTADAGDVPACEPLAIEFDFERPFGGILAPCEEGMERVYKVTTRCSEGTIVQPVIFTTETGSPSLTTAPFENLACAGDTRSLADSLAALVATDPDGGSTIVSTNLISEFRMTNDCDVTVTRNWQVVDCCGNQAAAVETYAYTMGAGDLSFDVESAIDLGCIGSEAEIDQLVIIPMTTNPFCDDIEITLASDDPFPVDGCVLARERIYQVSVGCSQTLVTQVFKYVIAESPGIKITGLPNPQDFGCIDPEDDCFEIPCLFDEVTTSVALPNVVVPLVNGTTTAPLDFGCTAGGTTYPPDINNLINDPFSYNPGAPPNSSEPGLTYDGYGDGVVCPRDGIAFNTGGGAINFDFKKTPVQFVDLWGRVDCPCDRDILDPRDNGFVIRLYDSCGELAHESGPQTIPDDPADAFLRYTFPAGITATGIEIDGTGIDFFTLQEMRLVSTGICAEDVVTTNQCDVTVLRTYTVQGCCSSDSRTVPFTYHLTPELTVTDVEDLDLGCISDVDQIPPFDLTMCVAETTCGDIEIKVKDVTDPEVNGCFSTIERVYSIGADCGVTQCITQVVSYVLNSRPPVITEVTPFENYGCDGDRRSVSDSFAGVIVSDEDGGDTYKVNLVSEVRTTNDCKVTVQRLWEATDCCGLTDQAIETYEYLLTDQDIMNDMLAPLDLGCIASTDLIPPPDFIAAGTMASCGEMKITLTSEGPLTDAGGGGTGAVSTGTPAGGDLVSDNCQDGGGFAPFNLQVRNTTGSPLNWEMIWRDRPYATIPSLNAGPYTHTVVPTAGGLFDHVFTGTAPLNGGANVIITGGLPTPAGDNNCGTVERYIGGTGGSGDTGSCFSGIERVYTVEMPCVTALVTQEVRYILDTGDPTIDTVLPFQDYGCVSDEPRPVEDSFAGLVTSDDSVVVVTNLLSEVRLTNDCVVTVTRTWEAVDCCANKVQRDETYQFTLQPDALALAPLAAIDLGCIDAIGDIPQANASIVEAVSSCSIAAATHLSDVAVASTLGVCYSAIDRTYQVTDLCGGTETVVQRIDYILDTANPTLTVPAFEDYGCVAADPRPADASVITGADDLLVLETNLLAENYVTNDCVVSVTRTWQVVDCCGKTAQLDETYQYTVAPGPLTVAALAPLDLRCIDALDDIPEPNTTIVDAMSDCAVASITFVSDVAVASDQGGCYEAIDRTYQVTDLCGGTATVVQRIDYIIDLLPPTIDTVPPFQDYGCVAADPQPLDITAIVASDADGHLVSTTLVSEVRIENDCVITVTRNWRVEDCCGKFDLAQEIYQYTVTPDAPTIASIDDLDLRCIDSIDDLPEPNPSQVRPSSSCTISNIEWVADAPVASTLGQCYSAIERTYQVTDKCGATVTAVQRIDYILDTSPPEILEVAAFEDYGCVPADPRSQADSLAALVLSDDLLIVETNLFDEVYLTNDCAITVFRTWQVIDCCDRTETRNETYTYVLQPGPLTVEALAPLNLECIDAIGDIPLPNTTIVDAMSDCLVSNIAFVSDVAVASDLGGCYSAIDRTYEATDRCGGTASVVQRIDYILDAEDPTLVVPAFVDYGCVDTDPRPADTNAIVTADDLLVLETNLLQEVRLTNDCVVTVTRTWQVVDCCGNTATLDETYRYTERPSDLTVTALAPVDLNCIDALGDIPQPNTTIVAAMSDCLVDGIVWTADLPVLEAEECSDAIDRVYEITDKCGGTASVTQRITYLLDVTDPVISEVAPFVDYGCVSEDPRSVEMSSNAVLSSDDHLVVATNLLSEVYLTNDCDITVTRLWEVTDCCGNTGTREETYRYTLQSAEPPTIPTIANFDLRCIDTIGDIPAPDTSLVNALSECPIATVAHVSDTPVASELGTCYSAIDRVYSATDNCGAVATITQRIDYLLDSGDPVITAVAPFVDYGCVTTEPRPLADSFAAIETSDDNLVLATNLVDEVRLTNDCIVVVTRTWQIWDCCSNENQRVETYQYTEQSAPPTISGANLIELGCITSTNQIPLPSASQFTVVSDCDTTVALISQVTDDVIDECFGSITRVYRVTDNCGQFADITQSFSYILNTRDPLITSVPAGTNYGCVADSFDFATVNPPVPEDVVTDDDNVIFTTWLGDTYVTNGCDVIVTRLWEVEDCCGATDRATATFEYRLQGDGPEIACPDTLDLGCLQALNQLPPPSALLPTATSTCGTVSFEWLGDSNLTSNKCDWTITRTYRATDECGLTAVCSSLLTFRIDAEPPTLAVSNFVDYGCVPDEPRPVLVSSNALVTADDSFVVATQLVSEVRLTNDCQVLVTRTWEVTDCCGHTTQRDETYRFTIAPSALTVDALAPVDLNCIDALGDIPLPNTTLVQAMSDCSVADISFVRDDVGPSTYCTDSLDRVYEITDLCGGTATVTQRFTWILDVAPPTIDVVPPFVDYGCVDSDPRPADTNVIIGSDADNHLVSTTLVATVISTNDCRVTVTRTWRVEDCCNKFDTAEESYAYTLRPTPVTVEALASVNLECIDTIADIPQPNTTIVAAESDCLINQIEHVSDTAVASELGQCYAAIDRVYQVTDRCSATAVVTQRFDYILDTGDPALSVPAFVDYGCVDADPRPADTNVIITSDDNLVVATNLLATLTLTNDCVITVTRTWQITDCCGNTVQAEESYRYTERPSPLTVSALADLDLRCIDALDDIPQPDTSLVDAQSDCLVSNIEWLADNPVTESDDCTDAIDRVYQVTDRCAGIAVVTQRITYILDTNPPMITEVAPFTDYGCVTEEPRPVDVSSNAVVSMDDHFIVDTNLLSEVRTTNDCIVLVTRLWEVVDCCGNKGTREETYQFTNQPAEPPTISGTPLIELGCLTSASQIPLPSASQFVVVSECRADVSLLSEVQDPDIDDCVSSVTRVYLVTDNCGQTNTFSQTFTYTLNTREPLITAVPAGTNYGCVADSFDFATVTPPLTNEVVVSDDNLVSTIWLGDTFVTNGCDVTVTRLWEVTDCCGATDRATAEYEYRLQGDGPEIECPVALDLGCIPDLNQIPEPASIIVNASSECGSVLVEHVGDSTPTTVDACHQSVVRTYLVTDECGLTNSCTQTITFTLDNAPPILAVSNFVDYGCVDDEPRPVLVSSNALVTSDDTSVVATQLVSEVRLTNDCVVTVTRTWEVTDCCNNTTEREETYRFTLRPSPITVAELAPVDLNCIDSLGDIPLPNTTLIAAQSDCSIADIIWLRDDTGPSTYCTDSLDRVYRITDLCSGTAVVTQRFTWILDVAPPTIDVVPPFVDYGCQDSDPRPADTNAVIGSDVDNHLVSTTLVAQVSVTNDCRVTVTRTWRVEDCCNKFDLANESYAYTLRPSTVTTAALAPIDLGCLDDEGQIPDPNTTLVDALSDCSVVDIEFVSNSVPVQAGCVTSMERVYRATDLCGGTTTVTQDISWVLNTLDPFIITAGTGTNYGCQVKGWVIPPASAADTNAVQFTDDNVTNVTWLGDTYATNDCLVTVVRTWEIIDCCDNRDRGTVEYTYTATPERPTITCQPTLQLGCITSVDQIPNADVTAPEVMSDCGGTTVELVLERTLPTGLCLDQIQRFYTVTDVCGGQRSCNVRILYVRDTAPPEITEVPPFVDNGCAGDPRPVPLVNQVVATDDRHVATVFLKQEIRTTNECQVTVQRIWRAEDCCGKFDERTETYQFTNDPSDPELATLNALDVGCIDSIDDLPDPNTTAPAVASACAAADVTWIGDIPVGNLDKCTEAIDRVYLATDLCGGTGSVTQRISYILDAQPPTIVSVPPTIDFGCSVDPRPVPLTNDVIGVDIENHLVSTQLVSELRLTNDCKVTVQRTWRVEDCCGRFDLALETYSYTEIPDALTVAALAPVELGCLNDAGQIPLPNTTLVSASSDCSIVSIDWLADTPTGSGTCVSTLDRTYQITDLCGGTAVVTQEISWVLNTMDPIITDAGIEVDFGCQAPGYLVPPTSPAQTNEVVFMDDNVTNVSWIGDSYTTNDCNVTVLRTWQVIDCCGNKARADVTYLFNIIPPEPDVADLCPEDIDLECITSLGQIPTPVATLGTVAGGCNIEVSHLGDSPAVKSADNCTWSFIRTNLVTDTCGVATTCSFTITYKLDALPPVLAGIPPQLHYGCLAGDPRDVATVSNAIAAASSDPDGNAITVTLNNTTVLTNDCEITVTRQWRVTDCCGRVDFGTEVYQYTDAPVDLTADALAPIELGCINNAGQVPQPNPALVDADSLCSIESVEWLSDTPAAQSDCDWTITRTYEVTDLCGMVIPVMQTITYTLDQNDPVIVSAPENVDFGCVSTNPVPFADTALDLVVTDDSLVVSRSFSDVLTSNDCAFVLVRTWTIVDCCGRTDETTTTYRWINRPDMPEVGPLSDRNLGCITSVDQVPPQDTSIVEANSDCSVVQIAWISDSTGSTDRCTDYLDRVYQVTDLCGASAVVTQRFTWILNTMDPMITVVPPGTDFGCVAVGFEIPAPNTNALVAMDDNLVSTQWIGDVTTTSPNGDCITTVVRTWQVVDCCGTKAEASATFTYVETPAAPDVATLCPPDIELGCIASPGLIPNTVFTLGQATADCDVSTTHLGDGPAVTNGCTVSFVRTNLATTVCGVSQSCSFRISYTLDSAAPRIVSVPDHLDYGCVELDPNPVPRTNDVVTSDDNQTVTTYLLSEVRTTDECVVTVTRTWRTEDCCDRSDVAVSTYTYIETPDLVAAAPADLRLGCIQSAAQVPTPAPSSVAADSACPILVEHMADTTVTSLGDCLTEIDRTYRVSDSCSSLVVTQRISYSLDDKTPKFLLPLPGGDLGCQPADAPAVPTLADDLATLTVTDNCEVVVMQFSETHTTNGCDVTLVRSYMAMDDCNNAEVVNVIYRWTERPSAPSIAALLPTDLGCIDSVAQVPPAVPGLLQISNACGVTSVNWTGDTSPVRNGCIWEIIRSFEVTDLCGGTDAIEQRITFTLDASDPQIVSVPETEHFECVTADPYPVPRTNLVVATDDSQTVATYLSEERRTTNDCVVTVSRIWRTEDCCNNFATAVSTYSYIVSPDLSAVAPADLALGCIQSPAQVPTPAAASVAAESACPVVVEHITDNTVTDNGVCLVEIERLYRVSDNCSSLVVTQRISYSLDDQSPKFLLPLPGGDLGCQPVDTPAVPTVEDDLAALIVTDSCEVATMEFSETLTTNGCDVTLIRSYMAMDGCNNAEVANVIYRWTERPSAPAIAALLPTDLGCIASTALIPPAVPGLLEISNTCGVTSVDWTGDTSPVQNGCTWEIVRSFEVTDICGGTDAIEQRMTFTIDGLGPSILSAPETEHFECVAADPYPVPRTNLVVSTDDSLIVSTELIREDRVSAAGSCDTTVQRLWEVTDCCGNVTRTQTEYSYRISPASSLACPADITVPAEPGCQFQIPDLRAQLSSSSSCGEMTTLQFPVPGSLVYGTGSYPVEFIVTDTCGVTTSCTMNIDVTGTCVPDGVAAIELNKTVIDSTEPGACGNSVEAVIIDRASAVTWCFTICNIGDLILENVALVDADLLGVDSIPLGTLAVGACTNVSVVADMYEDQVNIAEATGEPIDGSPTVRDEDPARVRILDTEDYQFDKTVSSDGSCPGVETVISMIGDDVTFCFLLENTGGQPLTNVVLDDADLGLNVAIGTLLPGESFSTSTTWSANGEVFVNTATVSGDGPAGPIELVDDATSTPFDCCTTDTAPPTIIEAPQGANLGCAGPLPEPDTTLIVATDNCGAPQVELLMATTNVNGCTTMATHRYRVSDVCGNFQDIDAVWMLTNDTTPPTFTCPEALEIPLPDTCIAIVPQITPQTFNEDCGGLEFTQTPAAGSTLEGPGTYDIRITANDACGNESSCMTSIKVSGICDSDLEPAITLEKTIIAGHNNGANCAEAVESITVTPGTPVTWCFRVINNGEIMLQNVTITDTDLEPDLQFVVAAALPPGQSASHFVQGLATDSLENQAGVNGQPTNGKPNVMDTDTASLAVVSPAILLVKTVSLDGNCPGEKYVEGPQSTPITYCFDVTNTGDVTLNNVVLDDQPLDVFATLGSLSPGQSVSYQQAGIIPGLLTNVAIATGSPAGGLPDISDSDEAVVSTGLASLSGIVWTDLSNDGDPNNENLDELGLQNATVYLFDANGNLVATTSTDNNGAYGFTELLAGEYTVEVDPNSIDPSLVNQSTPGAYLTDLPVGMSQVDFDFGFLPGATYVELEFFIGTVTADGVQLDWRFGFEQDSLGYNIFRDGKKVNEQLMLAGSTSTFLDVGARGGNYVLQVIDNHLDTEEFGPVLPILEAGPIAGPTRNIQAIDNEAVFNTSTNWLNYFIYGFDHPPSATDNTNRRQLKGEGVSIDGESGIYLHAEPEIEVEVK